MDRLVHFAATTALTLAGTIILGPGGASYIAQCAVGQVLASFKTPQGRPLTSSNMTGGRVLRKKTIL
jgi:hypothetical protein